MKKISSRTSVEYTLALASRPGCGAWYRQPSSDVVATTGLSAGSGPSANGSGQAAAGAAHPISTTAGAREPPGSEAKNPCPCPPPPPPPPPPPRRGREFMALLGRA